METRADSMAAGRVRADRIEVPYLRARRLGFAGVVAATTLLGVATMLDIVRAGGIAPFEVLILCLFAATFGWISMAFWNAVIGFVLRLLRRDPLTLDVVVPPATTRDTDPIVSRTALVMPIHNEDTDQVMRGLSATLRSLARTGRVDRVDAFVLSDTTEPAIAAAEAVAWPALQRELGASTRIVYRRRASNDGHKAGNIADFCRRWGADYDFMVVLDADSIMSGETIVSLARAMEANPRAGMMQTVPLPVQCTTVFGRVLQFAATLYGPMLAAGQSFWQADTANYWGHNAIVRVRAFVDHCRLPVLPGRPPLGGAILSHDFVEAALMRRAGWKVYLETSVAGSYEGIPANILDYATRDRRWAQGSLQHLRLLGVDGLHPLSRTHFVVGAMGYLSSVLWLLMLIGSTTYVLAPSVAGWSPSAAGEATTFGELLPWSPRTIPLLAMTAGLLFGPKVLGLLLAFGGSRRAFGGGPRLLASAVLEVLFAVVVAPVMMLYHSRFVGSIVSGYEVRWESQTRDGHLVSWPRAWRYTSGMTAVGVTWGAVTWWHSPMFFWWLSPIFVGLFLAAPIARWTSSPQWGDWLRRRRLFLVPTESIELP